MDYTLREYQELVAEQAGGPTDIIGRLEPGVTNRPAMETQIFLASIAISLKRLADIAKNNKIISESSAKNLDEQLAAMNKEQRQ